MIEAWLDPNALAGGELTPALRAQIDAACAGPQDALADRLWAIQAQTPDCLALYFLLYRAHTAHGDLAGAERAALAGFARAGEQSGLPTAFTYAALASTPSFHVAGPERFWLFSLKALALTLAKRGDSKHASALVAWIARCDPYDSLGTDALLLM